jgi:flagellar hook protein FlgE
MHLKGWQPPQAAGTADSTTAPTTDITIPTTSNNVQVVGFDIDANGVIALQLSDGTTTANYAQLAIATFANPEGLTHAGSTMFQSSGNSGAASYNGGNVNGRGPVNAGFLEMSNVDLATEFTNMIIAQRGFQGNSRVITAADEMLQDLVNIKR